MTLQEVLYQNKKVMITSIFARSGKGHLYVKNYLGRRGTVTRESKGGQLIVRFLNGNERAFPAGCISILTDIIWAK